MAELVYANVLLSRRAGVSSCTPHHQQHFLHEAEELRRAAAQRARPPSPRPAPTIQRVLDLQDRTGRWYDSDVLTAALGITVFPDPPYGIVAWRWAEGGGRRAEGGGLRAEGSGRRAEGGGVRSGKSIGFWQDRRRLNVALTRAKHVLRIVGSIPTWKKSNSIMTTLANNAIENSYIKQLNPAELIQLNIDLSLSDLRDFFQTSKWKKPIIDSRALNNARSNILFENSLSKGLVKICNGMKYKSVKLLHHLEIDKCSIDWSVVIDESAKITKIKIHDIRNIGCNMQNISELQKMIEKNGPEWNEICNYSNGPIQLDELPFKGKRPVIPKPEPKRDYYKEKVEAQRLAISFLRNR